MIRSQRPSKPIKASKREARSFGFCTKCRQRIVAGDFVQPAPGAGHPWRHVSCRKAVVA